MYNLRRKFMLDPRVTFLNHGSFGAVPREVFRKYQDWQRELERQPVEFLGRRFPAMMRAARTTLAKYLRTSPDNLVYTPNVTVSVNIVAHSLTLGRGDEVLSTDHEYGACDRTWRFLSREQGFTYKNQPISLPYINPDNFVDSLWQGVTPRTRVIFLSHITSPTAAIFPVAEVCKRARQEGIFTVIDGAHTPGHIHLNLEAIGADFYGGNLHKWLCAPKGAGFLYARRDVQHLIKPLIVSWGYESESPTGSNLVDYHEWTGTRDVSAYLTVPAAIEFQRKNRWNEVRKACHELVREARDRVCGISGLEPLTSDTGFVQFVSIPLPDHVDLIILKKKLYSQYKIEVPLVNWNGRKLIRVSVQGYNSRRDIDKLIKALNDLL